MPSISASYGVVGVQAEATAYTAETTWATTDVFTAWDIDFSYEGDLFTPAELSSNWGQKPRFPGGRFKCGLKFKTYLRGQNATVGAEPYWSIAAGGAGLKVVSSPATSCVISPTETFTGTGGFPDESYSFVFYNGSLRLLGFGGLANWKVVHKAGEPSYMEFDYKGMLNATIDATPPVPAGESTLTPPAFVSAGLTTIGTETPVIENLEFDLGNTLSVLVDANASKGIKGYAITARKPTLKFDPEDTTVADIDYRGQWTAGTTGAFASGTIGGTAGNKYAWSFPRIQYMNISHAERNGIRILNVDADVLINASGTTGSEFTLTLT